MVLGVGKAKRANNQTSESSASKRAKVAQIRYTLPFITQSALAALCQWSIAHGGLPDIRSRRDIRVVRDELATTTNAYGALLVTRPVETVDGGTLSIEMLNPWAGLYHFLSKSPFLANLFARVHNEKPSHLHKWRLVVYNDEVTPGNQLSHAHSRKVQTIYFSFLEFGPLLASEYSWFTATLVASKDVQRVKGGMSKVLGVFISQFWTDGLDMTSGGISIPLLGHDRIQLFADYGMTLSDELALHLFYMAKGASGLKCCLFCSNCFNAKTTRSSVKSDPWAKLHTHPTFSDFELHTAESMDAIVNELKEADANLSKSKREKLETVLGFSFEPDTVLFDDELRPKITPPLHAVYDWMHVIFVGGCFNVALYWLMKSFSNTVLTYSMMYDLLQSWHWPAQHDSDNGIDSFSPMRAMASRAAGTH